MKKIKRFNNSNSISNNIFDEVIHNQILLIIFQEIVTAFNFEKSLRLKVLDGYRTVEDKEYYTRRFVKERFNVELNEDESNNLTTWIIAYLRKSNVREKISYEKKVVLHNIQGSLCFYCKVSISIHDLEVDHKIPWSFVGDELENNLVATCFNCNREKKDKIDLGLKWLIMKK